MPKWFKGWSRPRSRDWLNLVSLTAVIGIAIAVRLAGPLRDHSIGEIDVYYWALRTQEFLLHGWSNIGTPFWVTPVVMGTLHRVVGGSLYDIFLWGGSFISGTIPVIGMYVLTREMTQSKIASVVAALALAINPLILYRSVFTVSETFAYTLLPWILYFCVRLIRRAEAWSLLAAVALLGLMSVTHDSAKLLVLPVGLAAIYFFRLTWSRRSTKILCAASIAGVVGLLMFDHTLVSQIKFFLWPNNSGNSAFGSYPPLLYTEYVGVLPALFTIYAVCGVFVWWRWTKQNRFVPLILAAFLLPILYYQQIQPRFSDATIVPFRLTPYLAFVAAPLIGLAVAGWMRLRKNLWQTIGPLVLMSVILMVPQIGVAEYPLAFVTGMDEQRSLQRLPISSMDYLITQTSMIGMTSLATQTNERNYYGDTADQVFAGQTPTDIRSRLHTVIAGESRRPTGVLISLWKLKHRDPYYGWFDSLLNPDINLTAWRSAGLPIRFADANIIIFDIPKNF